MEQEKVEILKEKRIIERSNSYCVECGGRLKHSSYDRVHRKCEDAFEEDDCEPKYDLKTGLPIEL